MILLSPGPVVLSERVRRALGGPDLCHREPESAALQQTIRQSHLRVYDLDPARSAALASRVRDGLKAMGIRPLLPEGASTGSGSRGIGRCSNNALQYYAGSAVRHRRG